MSNGKIMINWYLYAQNQDIYQTLSDLGISFNDDGSLNTYGIDEDGNINFSEKPKTIQNINKAISQQYIIYEAMQDEFHKYLAFIDDLILLVEKLNNFPVYNIPEATEKIDEYKKKEQEEEQQMEEEIEQNIIPEEYDEQLEEDVLPEDDKIRQIDEEEIDQPYPYTPQDEETYHPQYGYWYHPFNINEHSEKTPEEIQEDLEIREELEIPPFPEQEEVPPVNEIPQNTEIVEEVEEDVSEATPTAYGDAKNVADMIRRKYVQPLQNVKDELKIEIRDRFEELAKAYESLVFENSLNVVNMATRVRIEKDLRNKFERKLAFVRSRIEALENFLQQAQQGLIGYQGYIEDLDTEMQGYEVQRQNNNVFRVIKPRGQTIYYTDMNRRTCTCPWGRKVSPYKYEASACKHYEWIADLMRRNAV
jgi:hypothetical protein